MIRKILIIAVLSFVIFQSPAFALDTEGEVLFRDALYGAAIGALLGGAFYLADQDDFAEKLGAGVIIGTIGGLIYGVAETSSFVEIKKDEIKVAIPTPIIQKRNDDIQYSTSLLKTKF
jgi:hypothetical protein